MEMVASSAEPDETVRYEPDHLDLHCPPKPLKMAVVLKGLMMFQNNDWHCVNK